MIMPIVQMGNIGSQLTEALAGLDRTQELMNMKEEYDETRTIEINNIIILFIIINSNVIASHFRYKLFPPSFLQLSPALDLILKFSQTFQIDPPRMPNLFFQSLFLNFIFNLLILDIKFKQF